MTSIRITKRFLDGLEPPTRETYFYDDELTGFGARLNPSGSITFFVQYRPANSRVSKRMSIGRYGIVTPDEARQHARQQLASVAFNEDPAKDKRERLAEDTFDAAAQQFLEHFGHEVAAGNRKSSTLRNYKSLYNLHVKPFLGTHKLSDIKKQDIAALKHKLSAIRYQANRCIAFISSVFGWLEENELLPDTAKNPCANLKKNKENSRERYLTPDEANRLLKLLDAPKTKKKYLPSILNVIKMLLFTGARLGEICNLKWKDIDLEAKVLRLPDSKTGAKPIFLNDDAIAVINSIRRQHKNDYVMPGAKAGQPIKDIQNAWQNIRAQLGLEDVRLHDLRHTYASFVARSGHGLTVIGGLLGHKNPATTKRYVHLTSSHLISAANDSGKALERKAAK